MVQTTPINDLLGSLGLLERLDEQTRAKGVADYQILINLVKHKTYERVQGIGDDFFPDIDLYNGVGAIYPLLDRKQRDEALKVHLDKLDCINYFYVNLNHTPYIREPLLLADIALTRPLYWPGLKDEKQLWVGKESFAKLEKEIMTKNGLFEPTKVRSDFLVAYALMRKDFTPFGEDYVKSANPEFLNRVLKGIVALRFGRFVNEQEIEPGRKRLYELLPKLVHDRIDCLRQEADWTDAKQFR